MGNRVFYQQLVADSLNGADGRASDEIDVVTLKDYMQVNQENHYDHSFDLITLIHL